MLIRINKTNYDKYKNLLINNLDVFKEIKNNPYFNMIVYINNKELIGFIKYMVIYDRIEIIDLFVEEKSRKKKIGTYLLEELIKYNLPITLEVNINNKVAINLYKKHSFIKVAIRKRYYKNEDAILMERSKII